MSQAKKCDLCYNFYVNNGTYIVGHRDSINKPIDICPKCLNALGLERSSVPLRVYRKALINLLQRLLKNDN